MSEQKLLSSKQAAEFIGVTEHSLRRWRVTGEVKIPFIRFGRNVRYSVKHLEEFVAKNTRTHT